MLSYNTHLLCGNHLQVNISTIYRNWCCTHLWFILQYPCVKAELPLRMDFSRLLVRNGAGDTGMCQDIISSITPSSVTTESVLNMVISVASPALWAQPGSGNLPWALGFLVPSTALSSITMHFQTLFLDGYVCCLPPLGSWTLSEPGLFQPQHS